MIERILFVDDEPKILEAYRRTLHKSFKVVPAESAAEALELMEAEGGFSVIVSDMQMPEMNGIELLNLVKQKYPDTIRIMLTGNADQKTAIDAINTSDVHRFLNKPCPPDAMKAALNDALAKYQSNRIEKELLEGTVKGCVATLVEVLSIAKPAIFGRTQRIKDYAAQCSKILEVDNQWEIETVALFSQIGMISLPDSLLDRALKGLPLTEEQQRTVDNHPRVAAKIVANIPRMEPVVESLDKLSELIGTGKPDMSGWPMPAKIVGTVMDLTTAESSGLTPAEALSFIESNGKVYDPSTLKALQSIIAQIQRGRIIKINVSQLEEGMELAKDIMTFSGALLVESGQKLSSSMIARLTNFAHSKEIDEQIYILEQVSDANVAEVS